MDSMNPAVLMSRLRSLLPEETKELRSAQDGLAALLHTVMTELGFRLIAVGEDSLPVSDLNNVLPENWAQKGPGNYAFCYKHEQSSLEFSFKVSTLANRTLFDAIASEVRPPFHLHCGSFLTKMIQDGERASLDICTKNFTSPSFFPHEFGIAPLVDGFISHIKIADLVSQLESTIVSRIFPALCKGGYVEQPEAASTSGSGGEQPPPYDGPGAGVRPPPYHPPGVQNPPTCNDLEAHFRQLIDHHHAPPWPSHSYPWTSFSRDPLSQRSLYPPINLGGDIFTRPLHTMSSHLERHDGASLLESLLRQTSVPFPRLRQHGSGMPLELNLWNRSFNLGTR